jgi:hypothetical protein
VGWPLLADTMMPDAFEHGQAGRARDDGLGFGLAFALAMLD